MAIDFSGATFRFGNTVADTTDDTVTLDPQREYTLKHNGKDASGVADANAIFLGDGVTAVASYAESATKYVLQNEDSVIVGPGVTALHVITSAGAPTLGVLAGPPLFGLW